MPSSRPLSRSPRAASALAGLLALGTVLAACGSADDPSVATPTASSTGTSSAASSATGSPTASAGASATTAAPAGRSDRGTLSVRKSIGGPISPKSVVASGTGLVFAQNMMYRHSVTVYESDGSLKKTISDSVRLSEFGVKGHPGVSKGAPVEAAFSPDGAHAYVSNYSMYGNGFGPEGSDTCTPSSARAAGVPNSYVYRIDTESLKIDQVIKVGMVPKYVAVSPDGRRLLVTDWCSYDLRVIDTRTAKTVATIATGAYPRGIAVSPDSRTAYVAVMGGSHLSVVDLRSNTTRGRIQVGSGPRHVVMDPAGTFAYVTLNGADQVVKVDVKARRVVDRVDTGSQPRSMDIAADGRTLYVVNYRSDTVAKVRTKDLEVLQRIPTGTHPIGITYDRTTGDVWVAIYTGALLILRPSA